MDAVGNITKKEHQGLSPMTITYDAANRVTTIQNGPTLSTLTFDANGNQTQENVAGVVTNQSFDRENRLAVITDPSGDKTTMTYTGDGLRRSKRLPASMTTFIWDGADYLGEES
jgi:YD repeat-containing protein